MNYFYKMWRIMDNYIISRWQKRPSTAYFWYLPEVPNVYNAETLLTYQTSPVSPLFLMDYQKKLNYTLQNAEGIIILPYDNPIGNQINPEAAFQYALGLHDAYRITSDSTYLNQFWHYVHYFLNRQTKDGLWTYGFNWFGSKAPWYSALAQTRGASVMLRAWMLSHDARFFDAANNALTSCNLSTEHGGLLHPFKSQDVMYFEEYPQTPTAVMNGFMSSLICIWELSFWLKEQWINKLWQNGIQSLEKMLPHYNIGWWTLYDLNDQSSILNVNSPRYHLLEIHYLQILHVLSKSQIILDELTKRQQQYQHVIFKYRAILTKLLRKLLYH